MRRLAVLLSFLLPFVVMTRPVAAAPPISPTQARNVTAPHPEIFRATASNRVPTGGLPRGNFGSAKVSSQDIPALRTAHSRTYARSNGSLQAVISQEPVNYRAPDGHWQPIANELLPTDSRKSAFVNKANEYRLVLPANLGSRPVTIEDHGSSIAFRLVGADGTARVSGDTATYQNALPGVNVNYRAESQSVKESLELTGPQAATSFSYELDLSPGLAISANADGRIEITNASHRTVFALSAPIMYDASGSESRAISLTLHRSLGAVVVTLQPDPTWLASPLRSWPVVVDPSVSLNLQQACYISGTNPSASCPGGNYLDVGYDGKQPYRTLLQFDLSSVPSNAVILSSDLGMYLASESTTTATSVSLYQLTQAWTTGANWNTYDGVHPWTTPGGVFNGSPVYTVANVGAAGSIYTVYNWYLTALTAAWVNGSVPNDGVVLRETSENVKNVLQFALTSSQACQAGACVAIDPPVLAVTYTAGEGEQRFFQFDTHQLFDTTQLKVNVASGNLLIHTHDVHVRGTNGMDLRIDRYYNSLLGRLGSIASNWTLSLGADVGLQIFGDGSVAYWAPSGYGIPFIKNADGTFTSPTGIDATLSQNSDGTYVMAFHQTGEKYNFSSGGFMTSDVDKNGNAISLLYNATNQLASVTDTQGRVTTFGYACTTCNVQSVTDSAGRTYRYASSSGLNSFTDAAGKITQYATSSTGDLTSIVDPVGNRTNLVYDASHRVTSVTYVTNPSTGAGYTESFAYNNGNTVVTDPNGNKTTYYFDTTNRVTKIADALGNVATTSYTADSNPSQTTGPNGATRYSYDAANNPTQVSSSSGTVSRAAGYNDSQHPFFPTSRTNSEKKTVQYTYSAAGNVTQRTDPTGQTTKYSYGGSGTITSITDANGNVTSYQYDAYGNLIRVAYPAPLGSESFTYDSLSRMASKTDGRGFTTKFAYDAMDRLTSTTYADGSSVTASYDPDGNTVAGTDQTGTQTRTYDALNRLIKQTFPNGQSVSYRWDGDGNLTSETDAGGTITQQFNAVNVPTAIIDRAGGKTSIQNNVSAGTQSWTYPNGVSETTTSNSLNQIVKIVDTNGAGTVLASESYSYIDPATGQPTALRYSMTDAAGNVTSYAYDQLNRLTGATKKSATGAILRTDQYAYDAVGNMTSENLNGATTSMSYNAADQLTQSGTSTYAYDAAGNETGNSGGLSFSYNAAGQTVSITPPGGTPLTMAYTGAGQGERVQAGSTNFQYDIGGIGSMTVGAGSTYFTKLPTGSPLSESVAGQMYYYLHDALGSVIGLTDATGAVVNSYEYDPYGNAVSQTEKVSNPFKWIGGVWDAATQLYKLGQRYYSPALGRFTQVDPAHQCVNGYAYSADDPINISDPTGAWWIWCGANHYSGGAWWLGYWWAEVVVWCLVDLNWSDMWALGAVVAVLGLLLDPWLALVLSLLASWIIAVIQGYVPLGFWFLGYEFWGVEWRWPWNWYYWSGVGWTWGPNTWCNSVFWNPWAWCV
jgi:RHS repeat-associated protein